MRKKDFDLIADRIIDGYIATADFSSRLYFSPENFLQENFPDDYKRIEDQRGDVPLGQYLLENVTIKKRKDLEPVISKSAVNSVDIELGEHLVGELQQECFREIMRNDNIAKSRKK